ncbi:hypothetical protein [Luteibacter sp. CQ10]|uniref:hypothetical protein n=1 Tax=Luteibacter sp. CQ10 TaxID=2805821 RepID=UPI0034A4336C
MQTDLASLREKGAVKATLSPPRYAKDSFDRGINRFVVSQDPKHAVFFTGPFGNLETGDVLHLFIGDDLVPLASLPVGPAQSNREVEVQAPAGQLLRYVQDNSTARVDIWYAIVRQLEALESERLAGYLVDFAPPGGIPVFGDPSYVNTKLAPIPELLAPIAANQDLVMNVPAWENMTAGDRLFVRWGSALQGPFDIPQTQVGRPVPVIIPWSVIQTTDGGIARVDYYILDVVNNHSFFSKAEVIDAGVERLPAPILVDYSDGIIDLDKVGANPVRVLITYSGMVPTDQVTLIVDRINADGAALPSFTVTGSGSAVLFLDIPNAIVAAIPNGQLTCRYDVAGAPVRHSEATVAKVKGAATGLAPPNTPEFPDFVIDPAKLSASGLLVDIPRYPFLKDTDRITFTSTFTKEGVTYTDVQNRNGSDFAGASSLSIRVPSDKVRPAAGGVGTLIYTVVTAEQVSIPSPTRPLTIIAAGNGADRDLDFEFEAIRYITPNPIDQSLTFSSAGEDVMTATFLRGFLHDPAVKIGIDQISFSAQPGKYEGKVLYLSAPQFGGKEVRMVLHMPVGWTTVSFYATSVDNEATVEYQNVDGTPLHDHLIRLKPEGVSKAHFVTFTDPGMRIRRIQIHCKDVIRLDFFKFRGRS